MTDKKCICPHCETELKNSCFNPSFCKPCEVKKTKICPICKSEYAKDYDECPACATNKKNN